MKTSTESIRESLSRLNQAARLHELPDTEFETGGAITAACKKAGYDESGRVTVNNLRAWDMTVADFAHYISSESIYGCDRWMPSYIALMEVPA